MFGGEFCPSATSLLSEVDPVSVVEHGVFWRDPERVSLGWGGGGAGGARATCPCSANLIINAPCSLAAPPAVGQGLRDARGRQRARHAAKLWWVIVPGPWDFALNVCACSDLTCPHGPLSAPPQARARRWPLRARTAWPRTYAMRWRQRQLRQGPSTMPGCSASCARRSGAACHAGAHVCLPRGSPQMHDCDCSGVMPIARLRALRRHQVKPISLASAKAANAFYQQHDAHASPLAGQGSEHEQLLRLIFAGRQWAPLA